MRMSRSRLVVLGATLGALACGPLERTDDGGRTFFDDFEQTCDGAPCGWSTVAGSALGAQWVETFHPGDHALRFVEDGVTLRRDLDDVSRLTSDFMTVRAAARCEEGATLVVRVAVENLDGSAPATFEATLFPAEVFTLDPSSTLLRVEDPRGDAGIDDGFARSRRIRAIGITKRGRGQCDVSILEFRDGAFFGDDVVRGC